MRATLVVLATIVITPATSRNELFKYISTDTDVEIAESGGNTCTVADFYRSAARNLKQLLRGEHLLVGANSSNPKDGSGFIYITIPNPTKEQENLLLDRIDYYEDEAKSADRGCQGN
jgi:hypothetical protein